MGRHPESPHVAPFPEGYRASGLLLHITSLPSPYGIGDVGPGAVKWIDKLSEAGQSWWQALPLGPTGYGDSPYQSLSSFAGNGLLISPDWLIEEELLEESECAPPLFAPAAVDYAAVIAFKRRLLERAWVNFQIVHRPALRVAFEQFCHEQAHWLEDYALFRVLKEKHNGAWYVDWPADLVRREPAALDRARRELTREIQQVYFAQFLLFRQGQRLMRYGQARGVRLIGDLPFFVSPDSSDIWANPELFLLDEHRRPTFVAGVPPDYFSSEGQLWGNPVYNWEVLRQSGYRWCIDRIRALLAFVDVIRLDHFRGFTAAWHIPAGATTAKSGKWVPGPGADFFNAVKKELGGLPFIAEDLGIITPDVSKLRDDFQIPGTRVLQFAFDGHPRQSVSSRKFRSEHSRLHRHPRQPHEPGVVRSAARSRTRKFVALFEIAATSKLGRRVGIAGRCLVVGSCDCHRSFTRFAQSRGRGADERPRPRGRQLDVAVYTGDVVETRV